MAEHRMDTKVLQAMLADAWQSGHDAAVWDEWPTENPFWRDGPPPTNRELTIVTEYLKGEQTTVYTYKGEETLDGLHLRTGTDAP
jgi:hypothetical protein